MASQIVSVDDATKLLPAAVVAANSGTAATTFAAGNDSRITGALPATGLDAASAALVANPASAVRAALSADYAHVVRGTLVSQMATDGSDQTATMNAELAALYAAGGGTYLLPIGTVRIDSQITLPHDGSTPRWAQPPIRIVGGGHRHDGGWSTLNLALGGSVLDLRYSGANAKILTLGRGLLQIENVTLYDGGTSSTAFILTTNTTLKMRDCTIIGTTQGVTCTQDAILLGGSALTYGNAVTDAFQGYGSTFEGLRFSRIQRGFYGGTSCNGVVFSNNTWGSDCGGQTAFELNGWTEVCDGNTGSGNLIEMSNYLYGMTFNNSENNAFYGTSFWDPYVGMVATIRLVGTSNRNLFAGVAGWFAAVEANGNEYQMTHNGRVYGGLHNTLTVEPKTVVPSGYPGDVLLGVKRSYAESTSPGLGIFEVRNSGATTIHAPTGGTASMTIGNVGGAQAAMSAATDPNMSLIKSGSGSMSYDHTSIVRDTGDFDIFAGSTAGNAVRVRRGVLKAYGGVMLGSTGATHFTGTGVPAIAGTAGDWFWRTDTPATAGQRAYICTVTGAAGAATWVASAL